MVWTTSTLTSAGNLLSNIRRAFLFKKSNLSAVAPSKEALSLLMVSPAAEKTRSQGTSVAGMARYSLASVAKRGNLSSFAFHQTRGSATLTVSLRNWVYSDPLDEPSAEPMTSTSPMRYEQSRLVAGSWSPRSSEAEAASRSAAPGTYNSQTYKTQLIQTCYMMFEYI